MSKAIFKLLLVSGLSLTQFQAFSTEKKYDPPSAGGKPGSGPRQGLRQQDRVKFQRDIVEIDKDLDAVDREYAAKRQRLLNELPPDVAYYVLRAPLKVDSSSRTKIKTQRLHFKDIGENDGIYISATFTNNAEADTLKAALSPTFVTYIEEGGDYTSSSATTFFNAALANVVKSGGKVEVYPKITLKFIGMIEIGQQDSETAKLLQKQGKKNARTDKAIYRAQIGDNGLQYLIDTVWKPANLILNISYDPPKTPPAEVIEIRKVPLPTSQRPTKMMQGALDRAMEKEDAASAHRKAVMILPEATLPAASLFRLLITRAMQVKPTGAKLESVIQQFT